MAKTSIQNLLKLGFIQDEDKPSLYSLECKNDILIEYFEISETFYLSKNILFEPLELNFKSIQEIKDFIKVFDYER